MNYRRNQKNYTYNLHGYMKEMDVCDIDVERLTVNISDDSKVFVRIEKKSDEDEVIRYQYDNHLGSACLELDVAGLIISYEEYHPFGTTSYRSGANEVDVSLKRYKYCGKERDEETGLYYYGMRYYAAWLCRFINVDPLQFKYPFYTPFQYAGNMPITYTDLDGGEPKKLTILNPQELKNYGEPFYNEVDHFGGLGYSVRTAEPYKKTQTQTNVKKTPVKFIKPTDLKTEQTTPQASPDPTGAAGSSTFHQMKYSDIVAIEKYKEIEEKKKMANFDSGEIIPAPSEFERKKEEAYKSTGVFENTYRYDKVFNATAIGLFTTGTIATGAYFAL